MPKKGKHTKNNKSKQNSGDSTYHLFTMGELDLIFKIQFKDEDLEKSESNESNNKTEHYKLEDLNELKDLAFLGENEEIWEKIKVEPANENFYKRFPTPNTFNGNKSSIINKMMFTSWNNH